MADTKPPKVFISYAWEKDIKTWVLDFATRLRYDGVNAILDQWETVPGDQLTEFMEKSVRESDFVIFVCTPTYKKKSDRRRGGVGYEGHIITGEVFQKNNHRKFIPVLRKGKWATASPSWATSKLFIDFRGKPYSETNYQRLLDTLFGKSPTAPPLNDVAFRGKIEQGRYEQEIEKEEQKKHLKNTREEIEKKTFEIIPTDKAKTTTVEKSEQERMWQEVNKAESKYKRQVKWKLLLLRLLNQYNKFSLYFRYYIFPAILLLAVLVITYFLAKPYFDDGLLSAPPTTDGQSISPQTSLTIVDTNTSTPEAFETDTPIPLPTEITDAKGVSMVLVPAGEFTMGNNNENDNQKPSHQVYLESFYIDKYEVTNALYKICLDVGVCSPLKSESSNTRLSYFGNAQYKDYPVIFVDWFQAKTYCEWRGARLPTESEWEKAARSTDERTYPWGEEINCTRANYDNCRGDTTQVGIYESGKSIYGIYDLAGNVWEWVGSAYAEYPYEASDGRENFNNQSIWIQRGGSWNFGSVEAMTTFRGWNYVSNATDRTGFRCARSAP